MSQHAARDIDISARKSHGIDDRTIEDAERNRGVANSLVGPGAAQVTCGEDAVADIGDIALDFGIAVSAEHGRDLFAGFFADLGFLLPGIAEILSLARRGDDVGNARVNHDGA